MGLSRKAMFFTATAAILLMVLFIILGVSLTEERVETGLYIAQSAEQSRERLEGHYFPTVLRFTSYELLKALANDAVTNDYLTLPANYTQAALGTYANPLPAQSLIAAFDELADAFTDNGLGSLSITVQSASIQQVGTFFARATTTINYTFVSRDESVRYNRTLDVQSDFLLAGITDSLYTIESDGTAFDEERVFQIFVRQAWNNSEFDRFWTEGSYTADNRSPSIFGRLQGSTTASPYGVMTLIPRTHTPPNNRTSVDAEYFDAINEPCRYTHDGINDALRLSWNRTEAFNITGSDGVTPTDGCLSPPFS